MALNDKDKEFIKKTVDDVISKSEKTNQQKMSDAIKSNDKKQEEQSKKDRQATLEYLDKVGVLTLAEKMELFKNNITKEIKQTVNEAIPEDLSNNLKDTFKASGSNLGKGLHQGTNSLKALMRGDIFGSVSSALSGSINTGIGLAQGAIGVTSGVASGIGAVSSIISAKTQMAEKKKQEKIQKETFKELGAKKSEESKTNVSETTSSILESKQTTFVEQKEEKTTTGILKKGLGGLSRGLELVNNTLGFIATKQKLILSGIGLATVGILALVGWFENGGLQNLLDKALKDKAPNRNSESKKQAEANLNAQINLLKTNAQDMAQAENFKIDGLYAKGGEQKAWKKHVSTMAKTIGLQNALTNPQAGIGYMTKTVGQAKKGKTADIRFPVNCSIFEIYQEGYGDDMTFAVKFLRKYDKEADKTRSKAPIIIIDNIKTIHINKDKFSNIAAGTKIATAYYPYNVYGDYDGFIKKQNNMTYEEANFTKEAIAGLTSQYNETQDAAYKEAGGVDHHIDKMLDTQAGVRIEATEDMIRQRIYGNSVIPQSDYPVEKLDTKVDVTEQTPSVSIKETNSNTEQAQNNIQKIKEAEKKQEQQNSGENVETTNKNTSQPQANINVKTESSTPDKYSNNLRPDQYNRAANNPLNI